MQTGVQSRNTRIYFMTESRNIKRGVSPGPLACVVILFV